MLDQALFSHSNHFVSSTGVLRRSFRALFIGAAALLPASVVAQTTYNYAGPSGGTWSTPTDWSPTAPTGGPSGTDTATLGNETSNTTVIYDTGASGTLGALNFTETSGALNKLDVERNLQIGTGTSTTVTLGASAGTSELLLDNYGYNTGSTTLTVGGTTLGTNMGTIVVNSGGLLEIQNGSNPSNVAQNTFLNSSIKLSGGTFNADESETTGSSNTFDFVSGNFVMTSGTLNLDATPTGSNTGVFVNRQQLSIGGNFQVTGGTVNDPNFSTVGAILIAGNTNYLYLTTPSTPIANFTLTDNTAATTQSFYTNQQVGFVGFGSSATGTSNIRSLGAAASTGAADPGATLLVGGIKITDTTANSGLTLKLASNATQLAGSYQPVNGGSTANVVASTIDTNGHVFDLTYITTVANDDTGIFAPNYATVYGTGATTTNSTFNIADSATGGVIRAIGFDLSHGLTTNVQGDVVLNATGTLKANILSAAGGTGTISATSTFLDTGTGTSSLASTRSIGNLTLSTATGTTAPILLLGSNLTAAGVVTVNSGTLSLYNGGTVGTTGTYTLTAAGLAGAGSLTNLGTATGTTTITLNGTGANAFSGIISDNGASKGDTAVILSSGIQIFSGADTYIGGTTVNGGTLIGENAKAFGTGAVTVATGATLNYQANSDTKLAIGALTLNGGSTIGTSIGATAGGATIASTGALTTSGTNAVTVNIYGSGLAITAGSGNYTLLSATSGVNTPTYTLGTVFNNTNFTIGSTLTKVGTTALTGSLTTATALTTAYFKAGGYTTAPAVLAAGNGSTLSNWSATSGGAAQGLIPGAAAAVTFATDATTPVTLGANMSIGTLTLADTSANAFTLNPDGNTLTIGAGGIVVNSGVTTASTIGANVALGGSETWSNSSAQPLTVSGAVSGAVANALTTAGTGTIILSGANTFLGTTTIGSTATLQLSNTYALQNSIVTLGAANDLKFTAGNNNFVLGGLSGNANEVLNDTAGNGITLTLGGNNSTGMTYGGILSGDGGVTKVGTGTQTLTGMNTFTGAVTLDGGVLNATASAINSSSMNSALVFGSIGGQTGTLASSGPISTSKPIALITNGTFDTTGGNVVLSGNINGFGTLIKAGTGSLTIAGASNNLSSLTINGGTVIDGIPGTTTLFYTGNLFTFGTSGSPIFDLNGNSAITGLLTGGGTGQGLITNNGTGTSTLSVVGGSSRNYYGSIADGAGGGVVAVDVIGTQINNTGQLFGGANSYSGGTLITNSSELRLTGAGTLGSGPVTLNSNGTTGATTVLLSLLQSSDLTIGSLSGIIGTNAGDTETINNATNNLIINQTTAGTYAGKIIGGGALTLSTASTQALTLTGANTYAGGTTVSNGATLKLGNGSVGSATGSGSFAVNAGGTLSGFSSAALTSPGVVGTSSGTNFTIGGNVIVGNGLDANSKLDLVANGGAGSINGMFSGANLTFNLSSTSTAANVLELGLTTVPNFSSTTLTLNVLGSSIINPATSYVLITSGNPFDPNTDGLTTVTNSSGQQVIVSGLSIANSTYFGASDANGNSGGVYNGSYLYIDGDDIDLEVVPEPGTWALMVGGLALLVIIQRRRAKSL